MPKKASNKKSSGASEAIPIRVPVLYKGIDDLPIHFANTFLAQKTADKDEFIVSIGHIAPPVLLGSPDQMRAQAKELTFIQAKMLARFGMTEQRFRELVQTFAGYLKKYDESKPK